MGQKTFFFVDFCHIYLAWSGMWSKGKSCTPVTNLKINVIQVSKWRKNWLIIVCILQHPLWITPWRLLSCKKRVHSLKIKEKSFFAPAGIWTRGLWIMSKKLHCLSYCHNHTSIRHWCTIYLVRGAGRCNPNRFSPLIIIFEWQMMITMQSILILKMWMRYDTPDSVFGQNA